MRSEKLSLILKNEESGMMTTMMILTTCSKLSWSTETVQTAIADISGSQAPGVFQILSVLQNKQGRIQSSWQSLEKLGHWTQSSILSFPRENLRAGIFKIYIPFTLLNWKNQFWQLLTQITVFVFTGFQATIEYEDPALF